MADECGVRTYFLTALVLAWVIVNVDRKMDIRTCKSRIKFWESLRIPFNLICVFSVWFAWNMTDSLNAGIDQLPPAYLSDEGVKLHLLLLFAVLNLCYCLVYSFEFLLLLFPPRKWHWCFKILGFVAGCCCGIVIAGRVAVVEVDRIALAKNKVVMIKANMERMKKEEEKFQKIEQQCQGKASQPTPATVSAPPFAK